MKAIILLLNLVNFCFAEEIPPFEIRMVRPNMELPPIIGDSKEDKNTSKVNANIADAVKIDGDLILERITNHYDVSDMVWTSQGIILNKIECTTRAEDVHLTSLDLDVPFLGKLPRINVKPKQRPAKPVVMESRLVKPVTLVLPSPMVFNVSIENGKPVVDFPNPDVFKKQLGELAMAELLSALKTEISYPNETEDQKKKKDKLKKAMKAFSEGEESFFRLSFDRRPILKSVLEAVLRQAAPTLSAAVSRKKSLSLVLERDGEDWKIYQMGKPFVGKEFVNLLKDKELTNRTVLLSPGYMTAPSELLSPSPTLLGGVAVALGQKKDPNSKIEKPTFQSWTQNDRQYIDLGFTLAVGQNKVNAIARLEAPEKGFPKFLGLYKVEDKTQQVPLSKENESPLLQLMLAPFLNANIAPGVQYLGTRMVGAQGTYGQEGSRASGVAAILLLDVPKITSGNKPR